MGNKFIFDDPYIQGQLGEAVARGVLNLTIPHKVTMQKLSDFVNQGRLSSEVYDLIEWFDRQIDGIKISDGEDNVKVELYEVKTRLTGFSMFTNSRRKPKVTDAVLELSEAAVKIGVPMNSVIVDFYPYWRYSVTVKPFDSSDFAKTTPRKRGQGCFI